MGELWRGAALDPGLMAVIPVGIGRVVGGVWGLVEVVGDVFGEGGCCFEGFYVVGVDGDGVGFSDLDIAVDEQEGFGGDGEAVELEGGFGNEDVGDAGFVFE